MPTTDHMPTASKGFAALGLAIIAWYGSEMFRPLMPDGTDFGWFNEVNVALGLLAGWFVIGSRLGRGLSDGISAGLTGVAALVFWVLLFQSFNEMLRLALERRYQGPVEGLVAVFEIAVDYGSRLAHVPLAILLIGGGIVLGCLCEWVARRIG